MQADRSAIPDDAITRPIWPAPVFSQATSPQQRKEEDHDAPAMPPRSVCKAPIAPGMQGFSEKEEAEAITLRVPVMAKRRNSPANATVMMTRNTAFAAT